MLQVGGTLTEGPTTLLARIGLLPRADPLMLGQGGVATQTFTMLLKFIGSYHQLFCLDAGLATYTDASQNLCFPGIGVPWSIPSLQLGDQIGSGGMETPGNLYLHNSPASPPCTGPSVQSPDWPTCSE